MKRVKFDKVFMSWNKSQRSRNLANKLSMEFLVTQPEGTAFYRFTQCTIWTIFHLVKKRPKTIVLQYSFLLLIILSIYKVINTTSIILICDCHTKALKRSVSGKFQNTFYKLKKWSFSKTNLCILHNPEQLQDLIRFSKNFIVLRDPIPIFLRDSELLDKEKSDIKEKIVFVCSYDKDEPINEIVSAAKSLSNSYKIYMTGNVPKKYKLILNSNEITFTGYLADCEYQSLLMDAILIASLTTEDSCVQSAAFEAMAAGSAYLTSKKKSLVDMLGVAAAYTENKAPDIIAAAAMAIQNRAVLIGEMAQLKIFLNEEFEKNLQGIKQIIT
ncbi:MAG: hypothetical protein V4732_02460 [Pseudomonadota bacterium]